MNNITYDYYRIFYYVAKYKSLSKAASILNSNQPNITKFINKLEAQLDCKLMHRSNKGITLTPEGELLFSHVSIAYEELRHAEDELANLSTLTSGSVRIGATETALHGILLEQLSLFRAKYPKISLMITNYSTPKAISALKKGYVDFSVVTSLSDEPFDMPATKLMSFHEILIADKVTHSKLAKVITPNELINYPIVGLGKHTKTYEYFSQFFLNYGIEWQPEIDAATADQILPMVKAGLGIGFIPDFMANSAIEQGEVFEIKLKDVDFNRNIVLVEDNRRDLSKAAKTLKSMLLQ